MASSVIPLIVIVGETASGKSALAFNLAQKINGEIICADSRTIYKGMDIGTAKPTQEERLQIRHHLIDIIQPNEKFTVANFKQMAQSAIEDIDARGKVPILVGGTGLYVDALLFDYQFTPKDIQKQQDPQNPRHLSAEMPAEKRELRPNTYIFRLVIEPETLQERITKRVIGMIQNGLQQEVERLYKKYGFDVEAMKSIGYREWRGFFEGVQNLEETRQKITVSTQRYAKRQRTWFKRNKSIQQVNDPSKVVEIVTTVLNKSK